MKEYCAERKNNVSAEQFISFYESKGWMVGKEKMKSWKAAVRTWEFREKEQTSKQTDYESANSEDFFL